MLSFFPQLAIKSQRIYGNQTRHCTWNQCTKRSQANLACKTILKRTSPGGGEGEPRASLRAPLPRPPPDSRGRGRGRRVGARRRLRPPRPAGRAVGPKRVTGCPRAARRSAPAPSARASSLPAGLWKGSRPRGGRGQPEPRGEGAAAAGGPRASQGRRAAGSGCWRLPGLSPDLRLLAPFLLSHFLFRSF